MRQQDIRLTTSRSEIRFNTGGFRFNAPIPVERNSHAAKFDFNLTSKQQAFVRANVIYDMLAREQQFPDTPAPNIWSHPMGIAAGHTWTLTNNIDQHIPLWVYARSVQPAGRFG